jgi:peptide/nickel transport system substrate-binding protein
VGDLAESWQVSKDGLVFTIQLHRGVKFDNGNELTAEDAP